jgi:thioredoxin-dependent peroxiredoxin
MPLREGHKAPDFDLENQDGHTVRLSDLRGTRVVLYFYPKAGTPGCTIQACGIRDNRQRYEEVGAIVLGVSPDEPAKLREFADANDLPFTLLADPDREVAEAYGVWVEKSSYQRSTFLIDAAGTITRIFAKVSPKTHDEVVLEALGERAAA